MPAKKRKKRATKAKGNRWETDVIQNGARLAGPIWVTFLRTAQTFEGRAPQTLVLHGYPNIWIPPDTFAGVLFVDKGDWLQAEGSAVAYSGYRPA